MGKSAFFALEADGVERFDCGLRARPSRQLQRKKDVLKGGQVRRGS